MKPKSPRLKRQGAASRVGQRAAGDAARSPPRKRDAGDAARSRSPLRQRAAGDAARPHSSPRPRDAGKRADAAPQAPHSPESERVQKILARAGLASRREAEEWIRAGRITVNGEVATLGTRARGGDQLRLDGRLVRQASVREQGTYLCHRSPGELLLRGAREPDAAALSPGLADEGEAMAERLPRRAGRRYIAISPMPRIDGGLELLTADGELAARLQRLVRRLPVVFSVRVRGELSAEQIAEILAGELDSGEQLRVEACEPAGGEGANRWYEITTLGANGRELRSLVERQGATVSRMLRTALGGLQLDRSLARGSTRALDEEDLARLQAPPEQSEVLL